MKPSIAQTNSSGSRLNNSRAFKTRLDVSDPTFERRKKAGDLPLPDATINNRDFWLDSTIEAYIRAKVSATSAARTVLRRRAADPPTPAPE